MTTTVLVTGAAGYTGSILCEHLLKSGYRVIAVDNISQSDSTIVAKAYQWIDNNNGVIDDLELSAIRLSEIASQICRIRFSSLVKINQIYSLERLPARRNWMMVITHLY